MHTLIKIGLGLALAIVYPFMIGFGIEAFYTPPKQPYEICQFRNSNITKPLPTDSFRGIAYSDPEAETTYHVCYNKAQEHVDVYNRNLFLFTTAFGFLAIVIGALLLSEKLGPVGPGLVFGGLFTILYGTTRSFRSLDKQWIFIELVVVFIGIILVTWRYLKLLNTKKKS